MELEDAAACIQRCQACALACDMAIAACLADADPGDTGKDCAARALDCVEACRLAAAWLARPTPLAGAACRLCAEACDYCADACLRHGNLESSLAGAQCRDCAEACYRCAEECRRMNALIAGSVMAPLL